MKRIDITKSLSKNSWVFPGDPAFSSEKMYDFDKGDSFRITKVCMGLHTGTHIDMPGHIFPDGAMSSKFGIEYFFLPAFVLDCSEIPIVRTENLKNVDFKRIKALLIKTTINEYALNDVIEGKYCVLSSTAVDFLYDKNLLIVGSDSPSLDPLTDSIDNLYAHQKLLGKGIFLLENLDLSDASEGYYTLLCFPLKLDDVESLPVRAILTDTFDL